MNLSKEQIKNLPVFFIIGRPRSGSTLLRTLLDAHSEIIIPLECSFIVQLKKKYYHRNYWEEKDLRGFQLDLEKTRFFSLNNFDQQKLQQNLLKLKGPCSYQGVCKTVISSFESPFPKENISILGDKNPSYSLLFDKLFPIFSEAKFIHLVRDYRDNYESIINAQFENPLIAFIVKSWKESNKSIEKFKTKFPKQFYTTRYEDLVEYPEIHLKKICCFLEIPYSDQMLKFHEHQEDFKKVFSENIFSTNRNLFKPITSDNIGKWKNKLTKKEVIIADHIAGKYAEKYGYKREYKGSIIPYYFSAWSGCFLYWFLKLYIYTGLCLPFKMQLKISKNIHHFNGHFLYKLKKKNIDVK